MFVAVGSCQDYCLADHVIHRVDEHIKQQQIGVLHSISVHVGHYSETVKHFTALQFQIYIVTTLLP